MKKFTAMGFMLVIFLVGCASSGKTRGWSKNGASDKQIRQALVECQKGAPGGGAGIFARGMRQTPQQGSIDTCMHDKGFKMTN